ncbi:substrate-binding domain-containing protein [Clostridium estertheticum]|uniref:Substrate-binding domain-containing protein n=1 Tax=Clostridium estertheticum TaxID=238834 RepID=A0A7Y3WUR6_9CLOT|nr:substrate-binding domain-containing protein [Clostridium estertheticum]NNU78373.1 substrate-binding domain-containing protein [Clostridium estertheticum]WBL45274.1 substrate-binding domain-containing protein [Clostridium estertheticum]
MKKVIGLMLSTAMVLATFTGCGSSNTQSTTTPTASKSTKNVTFIPKVTGNAFFESANKGAQKYATKWGFKVDYEGSATASAASQVTVINQAVQKGTDGICISAVDAAGVKEALKAAAAAGVTVTTWDSDVDPSVRKIMVSQGTPSQLGQMLVQMSYDSLKERGKNPDKDAIKYCWHYSNASVTDQNSWQAEGEKYIKQKYSNWKNVASSNYYSNQDAEQAISVGESILSAHPDIDLIICNDSTSLPGQAQAAQNKGLKAKNITITGFASPNSMKQYVNAGILTRFGLWDCGVQGAMGCYMANYLASGNKVKVGDKINIPDIGTVQVMPNSSINSSANDSDTSSGVMLLPKRVIFTKTNMNNYNF